MCKGSDLLQFGEVASPTDATDLHEVGKKVVLAAPPGKNIKSKSIGIMMELSLQAIFTRERITQSLQIKSLLSAPKMIGILCMANGKRSTAGIIRPQAYKVYLPLSTRL